MRGIKIVLTEENENTHISIQDINGNEIVSENDLIHILIIGDKAEIEYTQTKKIKCQADIVYKSLQAGEVTYNEFNKQTI